MEQAQSLHRHIEDIQPIVAGLVMIGDWGNIDICYDGDKLDRATAINSDVAALSSAGFRVRKIGRNVGVAIDLTNVGSAFHARFVK